MERSLRARASDYFHSGSRAIFWGVTLGGLGVVALLQAVFLADKTNRINPYPALAAVVILAGWVLVLRGAWLFSSANKLNIMRISELKGLLNQPIIDAALTPLATRFLEASRAQSEVQTRLANNPEDEERLMDLGLAKGSFLSAQQVYRGLYRFVESEGFWVRPKAVDYLNKDWRYIKHE